MDSAKARDFIYKNARPLDFARWKYHFEGGSRDAVLEALAAYQNADGGFGHGLEADCWNPRSSPVQTWSATQVLREVGVDDASHPMIQGILRYLASGDGFDGATWAWAVPGNNDHPHAPWWSYDPAEGVTYNPTASLAGFALRYADKDSALYNLAYRVAGEAYRHFTDNFPLDAMHTAACFVELYEYTAGCDTRALWDRAAFFELLTRQISHSMRDDPARWNVDYVCKPSLFIREKASAFYPRFRDVCDTECRFIRDNQQPDGSWPVTWSWDDYLVEWAIAKNWWRGDVVVKYALFYREFAV